MVQAEIIAEIGINHGGDFRLAQKLIQQAYWAGADTVKFQMVNPNIVYQKKDPLYRIFDSVKFTDKQWVKLKKDVEDLGMRFLCTPGERESVDRLNNMLVDRFKVASDSAGDVSFVNYVMSKGKPVIVSTGLMKNISEVREMIHKYDRIPDVIMHCVSEYPTPPENSNFHKFAGMTLLKQPGVLVGYSDHISGVEACLAAVILGADVIEKHIKWDDNCVDAPVSITPEEFKMMVSMIRKAENIV